MWYTFYTYDYKLRLYKFCLNFYYYNLDKLTGDAMDVLLPMQWYKLLR